MVINGEPVEVKKLGLSDADVQLLWDEAKKIWAQQNGMSPDEAVDRGATKAAVMDELRRIRAAIVESKQARRD